MEVRCEKCQARYRVDDARIGPQGLTMRCGKCQNTFKVMRAPAPAEAPAAPVQPPAPPPRAGGAQTTMISDTSLEAIQDAAAVEFGISRETLIAHDRRPAVAFARHVAMYLARELTQESLPTIGARFGGRNHSTVLHALRKIEADLERDQEVVNKVQSLRRRLGA